MDSRFWGPGSDSDDDSDEEEVTSSEEGSDVSDSDSDSSDDDNAAGRFLAGSDSSDEEEDRRVVKSAKDKRFEELAKSCDEMRNKIKVNDWTSIQTVFDKMQKQLEKAMKTAGLSAAPRLYVKMLCELEDSLNETLANREVKKKMSTTNAKALNTMKQRLRKLLPEYGDAMAKWREDPVDTEDEEESEEESEEEDDEGAVGEAEDESLRRHDKKKDELLSMDPEKITYEMVSDKQRAIGQARGKRGTDRFDQLEMLQFLAKVSKGPVQEIEVLMQYVSTLFDLSSNLNTSIPVHVWQRAARGLFTILERLEANPHIILDETLEGMPERTEEPPAGEEFRISGNLRAFVERLDDEFFKILQLTDSHTTEYIQRLREEPVLLALTSEAQAYLRRIGDTRNLAFLALRETEHFYYKTAAVYGAMRHLVATAKASPDGVAAEPVADPAAMAATPATAPNGAAADGDEGEKFTDLIKLQIPQDYELPEDCHQLMKSLVNTIYVHGDERSKARAVLAHIYHKCIHGDFHSARDSLLMSHLQDQVHSMDVTTMIMYNRAMTQLGLCAFRNGLIHESHTCLAELYGSNRIRELLAQGMSLNRYQEKTPEQEKLERRRQMPFHMHINLEMVEAVYLTCATLLETPNIAAHPIASTRFVLSKPFLRLLETYKNQVFTGPPESVRDHIMAAARALGRGDWEKAFNFITALKMWAVMPERERVMDMLKQKLKVEGLRTYLFAYSSQYKALSLSLLADLFQLSEKEVSGTVSAMMMHGDLPGSWDQPTSAIVMRNLEESRLQKLAGQLSEKAHQLLDLNERALSFYTGSLREGDDDGGGHHHHHDGGGRGGGRGRGRRGDWDEGGGLFARRKGGRGMGGGRGGYGDRRNRRDGGGGGGGRRRDGGYGGGGGGGRRDRFGGGLGPSGFVTLAGGPRGGRDAY